MSMTTKMDPARVERRRQQAEIAESLKASGALDEIFARIDAGEALTGHEGLIKGMLRATLERGLDAELSDHLGYERGDPAAAAFPNSRNGTFPKTVASEIGDIELAVPRDRNGTFTPMLVPKGARRLDGLDAMIVSLYAGGMTVRDIGHHLAATIGTELSHETISKIVDAVSEEVLAWQQRPLEALYPVIYLDALIVKIRDGGHVRNKAAHIAVGVDFDGVKHVLGIWVQTNEGAKFWASVCAELANRGVRDVLIVCCDGLTGFAEAVEATWPQATVQTSLLHNGGARHRVVCCPCRRERTSADRPSRSRRRPVPSAGDGPRAANRSSASSALTSDGVGSTVRVTTLSRQDHHDRQGPFRSDRLGRRASSGVRCR
jgi:putative transposase